MKSCLFIVPLSLCVLLSSCLNERPGMFGRLPSLYEQTATEQRHLQALLSDGSESDSEMQDNMASFMQGVKHFEHEVKTEAARLQGQPVIIDASAASGLRPKGATIEKVNPGIITTVVINIPLAETPRQGDIGYLCFLDEDGEPVGKTEAHYDANTHSMRLVIPFAVNPDGETVEEGAFEHYDKAMRLRLVSNSEYMADNFEGEPAGTLLTLNPSAQPADTLARPDTTMLLTPDTTAQAEPDAPEWNGPVLTAKGIGPVTLGASLKSLPEHLPGVYDSRQLEKQYDEMEEEPMLTATFYFEGEVVMTALGDEQGNLVFLTVESPHIKIEIDGQYFGVGDPLQPIYGLKGVKRDETGAFAATYHGISLAPTPTGEIHTISIGAVW